MKTEQLDKGGESWAPIFFYRTSLADMKYNEGIMYTYRSASGHYFSCVAVDLEYARRKRDGWLGDRAIRARDELSI
jgi:hypothetical protein